MNRRGFSLIEVIVAVAVLAGGILGVMGAFSIATRTGAQSGARSGAAELAANELARATSLPGDRLAAEDGESGRYQWELSYGAGPAGLSFATVTVLWQSRGEDRRFRLTELFQPRAPEDDQS